MDSQILESSATLRTREERTKILCAKFERQVSQMSQTDRKILILIEERRKQRKSTIRTMDELIQAQKDFVDDAKNAPEETIDQEVLGQLEKNLAELERLQKSLRSSKTQTEQSST